jgi:hypothetical protein
MAHHLPPLGSSSDISWQMDHLSASFAELSISTNEHIPIETAPMVVKELEISGIDMEAYERVITKNR